MTGRNLDRKMSHCLFLITASLFSFIWHIWVLVTDPNPPLYFFFATGLCLGILAVAIYILIFKI